MADALSLLIEERDRLNQAIEILQGKKRRGRPPGSGAAKTATAKKARQRRGRPKMSAEQRRAVSERMKKYWAERKKAERK